MQPPKYNINEVVYFRESAAIGHLEAVTVSGIVYNGQWIYAIRAGVLMPISPAQHGDRVSMVNAKTIMFTENELITLCEALTLAEANATIALTNIQRQKANLCPDITE